MVPRRFRGEAAYLGLLALIFIVLFWRVTFGGGALLPTDFLAAFPPWAPLQPGGLSSPHNELMGDMVLQNYSWKTLAKESYLSGEFPLWNPYVFTGMPFLAGGQSGSLYPPGVLFYLLPVARAYGWFLMLHLFMGGAFMYLYLRVIGAGRLAALLSGVVFSLCGFLTVSYQWPMMVSGAIWLPFLLICVEMVARRFEGAGGVPGGALPWALLGSLGVALQVLAGHMEVSFYVLFTVLLYSLFRLGALVKNGTCLRQVAKAAAGLAAMAFIGVALSAAQLIPFAELMQANFRSGVSTYQDAADWFLPVRQIFAFLAPDIFGNPSHHSFFNLFTGRWEEFVSRDLAGQPRNYPFWGIRDYVEGAGYVGILPLAMAGVAAALARNRYTTFFLLYAVLALLLAFGSPLYALLYYGVPGFDQVRSPFRWLFPFSASIAVLAGLGLDSLVRSKDKRFFTGLGLTVAASGLLVLLGLLASRILGDSSLRFAQDLMTASRSLRAAFPSPEALYSYEFFNFLGLGLLLASGGAALLLVRRSAKAAAVAVALITLLDLAHFGYGYYPVVGADTVASGDLPFLGSIKEEGPFRVVAFGDRHTLAPNSGMLLRLQDVRGYDTVVPKQYVEFWRLMEEPSGLPYSQINLLTKKESLKSPILDLMNVKYVLTTQELDGPGYRKVYDGEVKVYRNLDAMERAFVVYRARAARSPDEALRVLSSPDFDPRNEVVLEKADDVGAGSPRPQGRGNLPTSERVAPTRDDLAGAALVRVLSYGNNRVSVEAEMPQEGYLVLSDAYFAGWEAKLAGGERLEVIRANRVFRAVKLPPGRHTVTFAYSPFSFRAGMLVSFMAAVSLLFGAMFWFWRRALQDLVETSSVRRVVKNSVTPMGTQLVNRFIDLGFTVVMLRLLGPLSYGNYAFAVAAIGYFSIFTDFGLGTLLTREVSKDKSAVGRYLGNAIAIRLALCLLSAPLLLSVLGLYSWRFGLEREAVTAALLFMVSLFPSSVAAALSSVFSAHEKMEYPAMVTVFTTIVRASAGLAALAMGWGVVGLGIASVVASSATMVVFVLLFVKTFSVPKLEFDLLAGKEMTWTSVPLMVNNMLNTIFFRIDAMLLMPMRGAQALGYYSSAYKFVDALNIFPSFITLALFPIMSRHAGSSPQGLVRAYTKAIKALLILAMPIALGTTIISERLVLLLFGEDFAPAAVALQVLIWFLPFSYINSVIQYVIIAVGKQHFLTLAFLAAAAFNVTANLVAISAFGILGAAAVTVISELVLMGPFLWAVWRWAGPLSILDLSLRPVAATAVMGAVLIPIAAHLPLLLIIAVGAAVYTLVLLALQTFDEEDRAILKTLFARS